MKLLISRLDFRMPSRSKAGIFFQLILVVVGVNTLCIESDCTKQSIKVINVETGECITCFPCLDCSVGTPSVPCGTTVPDGTDIHCVPLGPKAPALASKATAKITSQILKSPATSSFISFSHSSLATTKEIISTPVTIVPHSAVVGITTSKVYPISEPSTVYTGLKTTVKPSKKEELPVKDDQAMGDNLTLGLITGAVMFCVLVVCVCKCWKREAIRSFNRKISVAVNACSNQLQGRGYSATCTVDPGTGSAAFSCGNPKDDQDPQRGRDNQQVQPDQTYVESCEWKPGIIPPALDISNIEAEGDHSTRTALESRDMLRSGDKALMVDLSTDPVPFNLQKVHDAAEDLEAPSSCPPIVTSRVNILLQPSSTLSTSYSQFVPSDPWQLFDSRSRVASSLDQIISQPWSALSQTDKYNTKMQELPFSLMYMIGLKLDVQRSSGNDVRQFADKLGIRTELFECLQQQAVIKRTSTTSIILKEKFAAGTLHEFIAIMETMERHDIINFIETWKE